MFVNSTKNALSKRTVAEERLELERNVTLNGSAAKRNTGFGGLIDSSVVFGGVKMVNESGGRPPWVVQHGWVLVRGVPCVGGLVAHARVKDVPGILRFL